MNTRNWLTLLGRESTIAGYISVIFIGCGNTGLNGNKLAKV